MKNNINQTGYIIAILSLVLGTIILSFYLYFGPEYISITLGISFVVIAIIVNTVVFAAILGSAILNKTFNNDTFKTCGLMLLNIPVAILYFYMVITFPYHHIKL